MLKSESTAALASALALAQGAWSNPPKSREVSVSINGGGKYKFAYATLDTILDHIRAPLSENGLSVTQAIDVAGERVVVRTVLMHSSGEWLESVTPLIGNTAKPQEFGSAVSYARRYALSAMLSITADDDDDGNAAQGNTVEDRRDRDNVKPPVAARVPQEIRDLAAGIARDINSAAVPEAVRAYWISKKADLERIKAASPAAYMHLEGLAKARSTQQESE